jgi:hypothetical protein
MQKGVSSPRLMEFNDRYLYVVKFKNNPKGLRVLVNEFVAGELARLLELPVAPFKVVQFSSKEKHSNSLRSLHDTNSGHQFCSQFIPHSFGLPKNPPPKHLISNRKDIVGLIFFDYWIANKDRHRNNILLKPLPNGTYYVYLIDHSHCFPGNYLWTKQSLQKGPKKLKSRLVHHWVASLLEDRYELEECIKKIMSIPKEKIAHIIFSIPEDWEVSPDERAALYHYLIKTQKLMPKIARYVCKTYYPFLAPITF